MTRAVIFAVLAAVLTSLPAAAQVTGALSRPAPVLKRNVTVNDGLVRIGDILDNAGSLANVPIFRAPDIGTSGTVSTAQVLAALRPHDLFRVDTAGLTEIEVTRLGRAIAAAEIERSVVQALATQYHLGDPKILTVSFDREIRPLMIEPAVRADLQMTGMAYDTRSGRFDVTAEVPGSALARQAAPHYTGTLVQTIEVTVLTRALARGEVLKSSDVAIERRPKGEVPRDAADTGARLIGLAARQALRSGQILRSGDVVKPELIKRDDLITLIYEVPGILLTTRAKALETGAEGDVISVVNIQSKRTVQGVVTGLGQVTLAPTAPRLVTIAAAPSEPTEDAPARE